jgi:hypothetical protein
MARYGPLRLRTCDLSPARTLLQQRVCQGGVATAVMYGSRHLYLLTTTPRTQFPTQRASPRPPVSRPTPPPPRAPTTHHRRSTPHHGRSIDPIGDPHGRLTPPWVIHPPTDEPPHRPTLSNSQQSTRHPPLHPSHKPALGTTSPAIDSAYEMPVPLTPARPRRTSPTSAPIDPCRTSAYMTISSTRMPRPIPAQQPAKVPAFIDRLPEPAEHPDTYRPGEHQVRHSRPTAPAEHH